MPDNARLPNDLDSFWMPFTPSTAFKANPRMIVAAEGIHYTTAQGDRLIDGTGGLWCCNAGHGHPGITRAIQEQAATLDYAHNFGQGHPLAFEAASRIVDLAPGFEHVFFTNSGSESIDTALKIALAFHRANGEAGRRIIVAREKAYHGINFGGTSIAGLPTNKMQFGLLYPHVLHLGHTGRADNLFSRGQPENGADMADELQRFADLHGGANIAAVVVEPVVGAGGVFPPPKGYLERLRAICDRHGILLIFDEVITGFGRTGEAFAYQTFGVTPDLVTLAKGITNATVPMGGVLATARIRQAFTGGPSYMADLFHGYTYSGHPLASAAAIATLDAYRDGEVFAHVRAIAPVWEEMLHGLKGLPGVVDIRNLGLLGAVELAPEGDVGAAGRAMFARLIAHGLIVRPIGDSLAMSPPLVITESQIAEIGAIWRTALAG